MKAIVKQSPRHLLEAFCTHYRNRDMKAILSLFTKDAFLWGTGFDEECRGLDQIEEQLKRDWAQSEACEFVIDHIETDPEYENWIGTQLTAHVTIDGVKQTLNLRGSMITKAEDGRNKIRFSHAAFPAGTVQEAGQSFPKV